jgi:chromosome segregation ATPase
MWLKLLRRVNYSSRVQQLTLEISSLQAQLEVARTTMNEHSARLRERDASRRFEARARDLEVRLQERDARIRELEEELATAEAQAEVYEGRVQVYDKRVRAYKERVRLAEQQVRDAEAEMEALQFSRTSHSEENVKELDYAKKLLQRLAVAYGELYARKQERDREVQLLEWALRDKGKRVETLEQTVELAKKERQELVEELAARRIVDDPEGWSGFGSGISTEKGDSRAELDELLVAALEGQRVARVMEAERLELLTRDLPQHSLQQAEDATSLCSFPQPSSSSSTGGISRSAESELAQLRAECVALRMEQESLEQDLVDAAMDAEEHARQAAAYHQLQVDYASLEAELSRVRTQYNSAQSSNVYTSHAQTQADLSRLETEHKRLQDEFVAYKQSMEETARAAAEHEARAILLNGLQAREHALRDQMDGLRTQIAQLEKALLEERARVKRAEGKIAEAKAMEQALRDDIDE